ncbi:thermostable hemolysin [Aeromonas diversa]|uniref:Thermostable hemolysin n=1 Tax=Aeromonas diversa CDC 2478-85 TaxID=1268237 RepID=N9VE39_9GAMM|nr:thermostable hemolysin [Aeromonas diversa]ENY73522.1 Thermostable hemolysin [Aeromonas diversa CDC 2478-85]
MASEIQAPYRLVIASNSDEVGRFQHYIQAAYRREFGATIPHFLPILLGLYRADGTLAGACGLSLATTPLYLERYLDAPIETVIAEHLGVTPHRDRLIEVGNFACAEPGHARIMFAALCRLLCENALDYVVFTGTARLRNSFARLQLNPIELATALPERVGEDAHAWGHYYHCKPKVMVGDLGLGRRVLANHSLLLGLFDPMPALFPLARSALS